jgi:hypothetical protein
LPCSENGFRANSTIFTPQRRPHRFIHLTTAFHACLSTSGRIGIVFSFHRRLDRPVFKSTSLKNPIKNPVRFQIPTIVQIATRDTCVSTPVSPESHPDRNTAHLVST